jgi:ATP-binding cassette, subfamily C (CFTR/MRP), member 1
LLLAVVNCLQWEIVGIAFPRLCVVGFSIAQPFLVGRIVNVLQQTDMLSLDIGYGWIGATIIVFIGIAVCYIFLAALVPGFTSLAHGAIIALSRCPDPLPSIWGIALRLCPVVVLWFLSIST